MAFHRSVLTNFLSTCRTTGTALADVLRAFSLSLVKICCEYLMWPGASAGAAANMVLSFGKLGHGYHQLLTPPDGMACSADNRIWLTSQSSVQVFSDDGTYLHQVTVEHFKQAIGVAVAANGDAFVVDHQKHGLVVCKDDGRFVQTIGDKAGHKFYTPHSVALDREQQLLFVTESSRCNVQVLKLDGSPVRSFGSTGNAGHDGRLQYPVGIAAHAGHVAVADRRNNCIQVMCCF